MIKLKQPAIEAVARAMAEVMHIGDGEPPERDVHLYHTQAKLFLAGGIAVAALKPADIEDKPAPKPDAAPRKASINPFAPQPVVGEPSPAPLAGHPAPLLDREPVA